MEYPKRVRVVYSDGAEEVGTAIDPSHVDVGPMGLQVKLKEAVEIDGVYQLVAGFQQRFDREGQGVGLLGGDETTVRLRLEPVPDGWTPGRRKKRKSD